MLSAHQQLSAFKILTSGTLVTWIILLWIYYNVGLLGNWEEGSPEHEEIAPTTGIPMKIWYKLGPNGLSKQSREWIDTCLRQNPTYQFQFMTDVSSDMYVKAHFASRPDIVDTYLSLPIPILKADLLRYLLLFVEGGIWSDVDVSCEDIPIRDWIPNQYREKAGLVVGWEFDIGWGDNVVRQFATWMMMAKPRSPHLLVVIDDILEAVHRKTEEYNVTISGLTLKMIGDVVDFTGPRRMTNSVLKSLAASLDVNKLEVRSFAGLEEEKLVGDVLILPGYSFAASSNQYERNQTHLVQKLVTHHFAGSWKNDRGGE
ncbi:hypothetical protein EG329_001384 [Mollisiaceae sp. DMI_Dod_QoI]|nr:hypothetical protein EG329_001384 [Helotiales sp. DMI_Dod_QoI]